MANTAVTLPIIFRSGIGMSGMLPTDVHLDVHDDDAGFVSETTIDVRKQLQPTATIILLNKRYEYYCIQQAYA